MTRPHISIITPAYNASLYIAETIESVQNQSMKDWEMIISDDGSTDETANISRKFSQRDPRIRVISNPNSGRPGVARNRALAKAQGDIIAFIDADDLWEPDKLEKQMQDLNTSGSRWAFSNTFVFGEHMTKTSGIFFRDGWRPTCPYFEQLLTGNGIPCLTIIVTRTLLEQACKNNDISKAFDESNEIRVAEDWHLWLRLARLAEPGYIAKPLAYYRMHQEGVSRDQELLILCNINVIRNFRKQSVNENIIKQAEYYQFTKLAITRMLNTYEPWRKSLLFSALSLPGSWRNVYMAMLTVLPRQVARNIYNLTLKYI